ncbi:hypothetical protein ACLOJK_016532 [Asimina triloba]
MRKVREERNQESSEKRGFLIGLAQHRGRSYCAAGQRRDALHWEVFASGERAMAWASWGARGGDARSGSQVRACGVSLGERWASGFDRSSALPSEREGGQSLHGRGENEFSLSLGFSPRASFFSLSKSHGWNLSRSIQRRKPRNRSIIVCAAPDYV